MAAKSKIRDEYYQDIDGLRTAFHDIQTALQAIIHGGDFGEKEQHICSVAMELGLIVGGIRALHYVDSLDKTPKAAVKARITKGEQILKKITEEAEKYRHMSKENAAYEIAELVERAPGTVRRHLSKIHPGLDWRNVDLSKDMP